MTAKKIAVIDNQGPNSVIAAIKAMSVGASELDLQSAFVTSGGVAAVLPALKRVAAKGEVRVLTGLYQNFTDPKALWMLLAARKASGNRIKVKLSRETNFHRKAYGAVAAKTLHLIVGSSNLTDNGLVSAGELSLWVNMPLASTHGKKLRQGLNAVWRNAANLTPAMVRKYQQTRVPPALVGVSKTKLASIVGKAEHVKADALDVPEGSELKPRYWVYGVGGYLRAATSQVVSAETSWDRAGWDWQSSDKGYRSGDSMLLVDTSGATTWVTVMQVKGEAGPLETPDGRYFVAYTQIPKTHRRKLTRQLRKELKTAGVPTLDGTRRRLSAKCWSALLERFR